MTIRNSGHFFFDLALNMPDKLGFSNTDIFRTVPLTTENFLTGLRVVFDRERMILGWKKFNCKCRYMELVVYYLRNRKLKISVFSGYDVEDSNHLPVSPRNNTAAPPSIAFGPKSYTPEATKENGNNGTEVTTVLTPGAAAGSRSSLMNSLTSTILVFILLPLLII